MIKIGFNPSGVHTLCDRCRKIVATDFNDLRDSIGWEYVEVPDKAREGKKRRYDFCDEKCRILYFRGRKYWQKKQSHREANGCIREP